MLYISQRSFWVITQNIFKEFKQITQKNDTLLIKCRSFWYHIDLLYYILICYKFYITIQPSFHKEILEKGGYIQMIKFTVKVLIMALIILFVFETVVY